MPTLDPRATLVALADAANPSHPQPFTLQTVAVDNVAPYPRPDEQVNSQLTVHGTAHAGYAGTANFYYVRHDIAADFASAQIVPTLPLDGLTSWQALADKLNARYNTQFTAIDLPNLPWPHPEEGPLVFPMNGKSLFYQGSLTIELTAFVGTPPLDQAIVVTTLNGLVGPNP